MKKITIESTVSVFNKEELPGEYKQLVEAATQATENAYAPYSNFHVGASVLLSNGIILTGNNQENAAYPSGLCAERVVLFNAGSQFPAQKIEAIAITATTEGRQVDMVTPCGACRQVMIEAEKRYKHSMKVLLCGKEEVYLIDKASSLLPLAFDLDIK